MSLDISLVESSRGLTIHRADCPVVEAARIMGYPIATLFGCERLPETDVIRRHDCLKEEEKG